ncbi:armadillo-type protein [Mycena galopus ATCC 62051]|nr:armadillo-type protein [Mycena galopus ATCC 62051]
MAQYEAGAYAIVNADAMDLISMLLESLDPPTRLRTYELVGRLASHECTAPVILELKPWRIVTLLRDHYDDFDAIEMATYASSQIARWVGGAEAIIKAQAIDCFLALLQSSKPSFERWACELVGRLASHESTVPAILDLEPCRRLVALLHHSNSDVIEWATYALSQIARWPDGAQAVVKAKALDSVLVLLDSPRSATYALSQIARWPDGAQAVVKAKALDSALVLLDSPGSKVREWIVELLGGLATHDSTALTILDPYLSNAEYPRATERAFFMLLESPNPHTRLRTCELLGRLSHHNSTAPAISKLCMRIASLLGDKYSLVIERAPYALSDIAKLEDCARVIVNTMARDLILNVLQSPNPSTQTWACALVGRLANHDSTARAISKLCVRIVSLLGGRDSHAIQWAASTLSEIARWVDGAQAIVKARVTDHILTLLESPNSRVACKLVRRLARHKFTAPAILQSQPSQQIASLLADDDMMTRDSAISALEALSEWPDGVLALTDGHIAQLEGLSHDQSLDHEKRVRIRKIRDNIARYSDNIARYRERWEILAARATLVYTRN